MLYPVASVACLVKPDAVEEGEIQESYQLQRGGTEEVRLPAEASRGDSDGDSQEPA